MKKRMYAVLSLSILLTALVIMFASQHIPVPEQRKPDQSPAREQVPLHPGEEIVYRDLHHLVIAGNSGLRLQDRRTGNITSIHARENRILTVERIGDKPTGVPPVPEMAFADALRIVGTNEVHIVETEPTVQLQISYPNPRSTCDKIIVSKGSNKLYLYQGGELVRHYPVATGKQPEYTPEGSFTIANKVPLRNGDNPDALFGVRWMGLAVPCKKDKRRENDVRAPYGHKYGIHGTNEPDSIGTYASGGCIRLRNEDVTQLYELVQVGTPVEITP